MSRSILRKGQSGLQGSQPPEYLAPRGRQEAVTNSRDVDQIFLLVEPDNNRVNPLAARNVSADHKFLPGITRYFIHTPCSDTLASSGKLVLRVADDSIFRLWVQRSINRVVARSTPVRRRCRPNELSYLR